MPPNLIDFSRFYRNSAKFGIIHLDTTVCSSCFNSVTIQPSHVNLFRIKGFVSQRGRLQLWLYSFKFSLVLLSFYLFVQTSLQQLQNKKQVNYTTLECLHSKSTDIGNRCRSIWHYLFILSAFGVLCRCSQVWQSERAKCTKVIKDGLQSCCTDRVYRRLGDRHYLSPAGSMASWQCDFCGCEIVSAHCAVRKWEHITSFFGFVKSLT